MQLWLPEMKAAELPQQVFGWSVCSCSVFHFSETLVSALILVHGGVLTDYILLLARVNTLSVLANVTFVFIG